jgi:hypothetical protein
MAYREQKVQLCPVLKYKAMTFMRKEKSYKMYEFHGTNDNLF